MRFTECGPRWSVVVGIDAATRERRLARVAAHVRTAFDQQQVRTRGSFTEQDQYGGLPRLRGRSRGPLQQRFQIWTVDGLEQWRKPLRRNGFVAHTVTPR
jgi:hypothetical protein